MKKLLLTLLVVSLFASQISYTGWFNSDEAAEPAKKAKKSKRMKKDDGGACKNCPARKSCRSCEKKACETCGPRHEGREHRHMHEERYED